ncbi:MAG: right-handed parallel beta-helix repeat-containing protein [Anaerolineae bacterium]|nr:right-handed parallel beta-helix repeat-containing protein [Anaerolineae bacterium]
MNEDRCVLLRLSLAILVALLVMSCSGASDPATATPSPTETEQTSVPAPRTTPIYVSTDGSDAAGDGSLGSPYRTIDHALASAQAGADIVLRGAPGVADNVYAESVRIREPNITLRSQEGEWAIIQCPANDEDIDTCVHFDVDSSGGRLQRVEVVGGYYYGVKFETRWDWGDPDDRAGASNILIEDVVIHDTGNAAIKVTPGCDDITIRRAEVYNTGLTTRPDSAEGIDNVNGDRMIVQDSYFHDIAGTGLYFKGGAMDCVVERNRIERTGTACSDDDPCGGGIFAGFDTSPEFFDLTVNPDYYESIRGVVRNNLIQKTKLAGIGLYAAQDAQIWNNTLIDTAQVAHSPIYFGITFQDWDPEAGRPPSINPVIKNNLVVQDTGLPQTCISIRYVDELGGLSALEGEPVMDHNLYYHRDADCVFTDNRPGSLLEEGTLAQWQNHINGEAHSLTANPQLGADGRLSEASPALDAGSCTGAPVDDLDGDARPQGAGCDIGADEFVMPTTFTDTLYLPLVHSRGTAFPMVAHWSLRRGPCLL